MNNTTFQDDCIWQTAAFEDWASFQRAEEAVRTAALFFGLVGFVLNLIVTRGLVSAYGDRAAARTKITLDLNLSITDTGCCIYSVVSAISGLVENALRPNPFFLTDQTGLARARRALDYIVQIAPAVNYTGLFALQFLQFTHPLTWKQRFTSKRCLWVIFGQWVVIAVTVPLVTLKQCLSGIDTPGYAETGMSLRAIRTAIYGIKLFAVSLGASALIYAFRTKIDVHLATYGRKKQNLAVRIALVNVGILFFAITLTLCADLAQWPYYIDNFHNTQKLLELESDRSLNQSAYFKLMRQYECEAFHGIVQLIWFQKMELMVNLVWIVRMSLDPIGQIIRDRDIVKSQFLCCYSVKRTGGVRGRSQNRHRLVEKPAFYVPISPRNLTLQSRRKSSTLLDEQQNEIREIATTV